MLNELTISGLAASLERREISARQVLQACLDRIERVEGRIHAFISIDSSDALAQADAKTPLAFDPTQYLAVVAGSPPQRLGITLRRAH